MKITSKEQAFEILDTQLFDIPFGAIDFLYNHAPDEEILNKVRFALENCYSEHYYNEQLGYNLSTPIWYAIIAEKHFDLTLLDPIIALASVEDDEDWDFINDQINILIGLLGNKYGHVVTEKVLNAVEALMEKNSYSPYLFLFDALFYADEKKHHDQIARLLEHPNNAWVEAYTIHLSEAQFSSFLPNIQTVLDRVKDEEGSEMIILELKEAIEELEAGVNTYPEQAGPLFERIEDWKKRYKGLQKHFSETIEDEDEYFDDYDEEVDEEYDDLAESFKPKTEKAKKIGLNDSCSCGSGKKYKNCCM